MELMKKHTFLISTEILSSGKVEDLMPDVTQVGGGGGGGFWFWVVFFFFFSQV